jgi:hypothetical protein
MAITPAQLATRYRGFAAQCLVLAQHQHIAGDRLALINMAQAWVALAEQAEKNEPLFMVNEQSGGAAGEDD